MNSTAGGCYWSLKIVIIRHSNVTKTIKEQKIYIVQKYEE